MNEIRDDRFDTILVGGGLQNGLIALALLRARPDARIALIERSSEPGGNHTWCFHADDVSSAAARGFVDRLVAHRWEGYDVLFPGRRRTLRSGYAAVTSERFAAEVTHALRDAPGCELLLSAEAVDVQAHRVTLADGRTFHGELVVDARGPRPAPVGTAGYQKFVGHELELEAPHGLQRPTVMDSTVDQVDGFRFFYVLPFAADRVLVEDTCFSDSPDVEQSDYDQAIERYVERRGWQVRRRIRSEMGVLPMPMRGALPVDATSGPLIAGYRGGFLHPATGYSFPLAVRIACLVADNSPAELFGAPLAGLVRDVRRQVRYAHLLNRLLFRWYMPEARRPVFERFYRLPEHVIRRFYALRCTHRDRVRILLGRPPRGVSLRARLSVASRLYEPTGS